MPDDGLILAGARAKIYVEALTTQIEQLYRSRQRSLVTRLAKIDLTAFERYRTEEILKQINAELAFLDRGARDWAKTAGLESYRRGVSLAEKRLRALDVTDVVDFGASIHTSAVDILIDDMTIDLLNANQSMRRVFRNFIRRTQQTLLEEREISKMIAAGVIEGATRKQTSDVILAALRKRMAGEQFILINGRHYRPDHYAALVARTRTREAATLGTINTCLQYGNDLVQVSAHAHVNRPGDVCPEYAGRVFSISGANPDFPHLSARPPFHPHCCHVLTPITAQALKSRGMYDDVSKLSRNRTAEIDSLEAYQEAIA